MARGDIERRTRRPGAAQQIELDVGRGGNSQRACQERGERIATIAAHADLFRHAPHSGGAYAVEHAEHSVPSQLVGWVVEHSHQGEQVFDVRGFEKLEPAELDERNVTAGEFEFEASAVLAGAEQHGLSTQIDPLFAQFEDGLADHRRLGAFVVADGEHRS